MKIENPKISCVIMTNDNLECIKAVDSTLNSCFEVIVVNTVETTKVNEVLKNNERVKMLYYEWCDDYSKPRNYGIDNASGDWILTLDSDEVLLTEIKSLDDRFIAYQCRQLNPEVDGKQSYGLPSARVFQNKPGIRYKNKVHETIDHVLTPDNHCDSNLTIGHTGYDISEEQMKAKVKRNNDIMKNDKENAVYNLHMGNMEFHENKDYEKALKFYRKALRDNLNESHMAVIWINIHACQYHLKMSVNILIDSLKRSLFYEPFQTYCRVNIVEHLLSILTEENKDTYLYLIRSEIGKIERISDYGIGSLIIPDIAIPEGYVNEKYEILSKWGLERIAV